MYHRLRGSASTVLTGNRLERGKWQNLTPHRFNTPKPIADQIYSQSIVELFLLLVSENQCTPYWNSTSGLNVDIFVIIGRCFYISVPNFIHIKPSTARDFLRWQPAAILDVVWIILD